MRSVKVGLEADVKGFIEPVDRAKEKLDGLDGKLDSVDRSLGKVGAESAKAGAGVKEMGDSAEKASTKTEKLRDSSGRFVKAGTEMAETAHRAKESVDDLKDKVTGLDHALGEIPADAVKAAAAMALLKGDVSELDHSFAAVGDRSTAFTVLERRISDTRGEVRKLTDEFEKTGDVDIFRKLGKTQGDLATLNEFRKRLADAFGGGLKDGENRSGVAGKLAGDIEKAGIDGFTKVGMAIEEMLPKAISAVFSNPATAAAAGALAVAFGSMLAAAAGGAIIAAGAGGVAALGVLGAVKSDPKQIGAAWSSEISRIKGEWLDASTAFVGPTVNAIHVIGTEISKAPIHLMFAKAAEYVEPLAKGVAGFADGIIRGVDALVERGGPAIQVLKEELPEVGRAIEQSLSAIAGGNRGAADGLRDILHVVEAVIVAFGQIIRSAEDFYHALKTIGDGIREITDHIPFAGWLTGIFDPKPVSAYAVTLDGASHGMDKYATETEKAKAQTDELNDKIKSIDDAFSNLGKSVQGEFVDKIIDQFMALDNATIAWHDSLNKLSASVDKHGQSLDLNTDAGVRNEKAILAAVKANAELYQQNLLNKVSAEDAGKIYDKNAEQLRRSAIAAGFNAGQVDNLIGKYKNIPEKVQTILATIGLTDALNHLAQILVDFRNLNDKEFKTKYTVTTEYVVKHTGNVGGKEGPGKYALGGVRKAAAGMIVAPSDPGTILMGEPQTGGEVLTPLRGLTQSAAMNYSQIVGNAYDFDVSPRGARPMGMVVELRVTGSGELRTLLQGMVRKGQLQLVPS